MEKYNKISVVIPARYASSRFPGKMIHPILGKPLIVRVFEGVYSEDFAQVVVLTDNDKVKKVLEQYNIPYIMTDPECGSGTERVSSALEHIKGEYIINVQGDEPLVTPDTVKELGDILLESGQPVATLARPEKNGKIASNPNVVKVVLDKNNNAMYFSRSLIPYPREEGHWLLHVGMYGYTRTFLEQYDKISVSEPERMEKLEQLSFLYNGFKIAVKVGNYNMQGVDVLEDVKIVEKLLRDRK